MIPRKAHPTAPTTFSVSVSLSKPTYRCLCTVNRRGGWWHKPVDRIVAAVVGKRLLMASVMVLAATDTVYMASAAAAALEP
jgi:hypothetical protein